MLAGYGNKFRHGLYLFVRVDDGALGRRWIDRLLPHVTCAVPWGDDRPEHTLNLAFTCDGLRALGLPEPLLATFPAEFREGMAARCEWLGDTGLSAPSCWDAGLRQGEPHVLLSIFSLWPEILEQQQQERLAQIRWPGSGLTVLHEQVAHLLGDPAAAMAREHFGFADGFAQPTIRGNAGPHDRGGGGTARRRGRWKPLAPGEFVLGYRGEDGTVATTPESPLRRSGTFTVVRKLHQDVAAFTNYLKRASNGTAASEEWLAARIVGRWRDGTPVELSPDVPDPDLSNDSGPGGKINDFRYGADGEGLRCPLGAHVRRANPRDTFGWQGRLTKRHRIIRRSMPYGDPPRDPAQPDGLRRGLMFLCHQSSIERQFEVIQRRWMYDGDAFWLGGERDMVTMGEQGNGMTIPARPPVFLKKSPPFVINKGGGYFFTPGISSLETIAAGGWL